MRNELPRIGHCPTPCRQLPNLAKTSLRRSVGDRVLKSKHSANAYVFGQLSTSSMRLCLQLGKRRNLKSRQDGFTETNSSHCTFISATHMINVVIAAAEVCSCNANAGIRSAVSAILAASRCFKSIQRYVHPHASLVGHLQCHGVQEL